MIVIARDTGLRVFVGLILALGSASAALAQNQSRAPKSQPPAFEAGEELVYEARFSRTLLPRVQVASFRFTAKAAPSGAKVNAAGGNRQYTLQLTGDVSTKGLFSKIFDLHFHEHMESSVDPVSFAVLRTTRLDEQGQRVRLSEAVFDHDTHRVTWTERDPKAPGQPPHVEISSFKPPIQDLLSAIYFLRAQPVESGNSLQVAISDSGEIYYLNVKITERKRMRTALGLRNVLRVEPELFDQQRILQREVRLSIWVTDDARHIPIRAQLKVDFGTFDIKLKKATYNVATQNHASKTNSLAVFASR